MWVCLRSSGIVRYFCTRTIAPDYGWIGIRLWENPGVKRLGTGRVPLTECPTLVTFFSEPFAKVHFITGRMCEGPRKIPTAIVERLNGHWFRNWMHLRAPRDLGWSGSDEIERVYIVNICGNQRGQIWGFCILQFFAGFRPEYNVNLREK